MRRKKEQKTEGKIREQWIVGEPTEEKGKKVRRDSENEEEENMGK